MIAVGGRGLFCVGGATPGEMVPACIRKHAEQSTENKPLNCIPLWAGFEFLSLLPSVRGCGQI